MRVHTCRHCGEVFPSYPDLRQHLDSHVQPPIGHICTTCKKSFTRREYLLKHSSRCRPKPFACDVCNSSFGRKQDLNRHKRTVQCGGPPQPVGPAPKRRRIVASLNGDPVLAPPVEHAANDELSSAIRYFVHENWASVPTHVVNGPVQTRYNHRLTSLDTRDLHDQLFLLFEEQTTAFKVNVSFGFILKQKATSRLRYYHSSNNCCGRYLEEPSLITNRDDFESFLERIRESDILQWAVAQRPNSDWVCEHVTNATFFFNRIVDHPIGCVGVTLPDNVKTNKAIVGLAKDEHGAICNDNLCVFSDVSPSTWDARPQRCMPSTRTRPYTTLPVSRSMTSTRLKASSKPTWSSISLWRSIMGRRWLSWFVDRRLNTKRRCT